MSDPRNEMKCSVWEPRTGPYGDYVMVTFTVNGVEYICFANRIDPPINNPKAPKFSGTVKVSNRNDNPQQTTPQQNNVQQQETASQPNQEDDLPF